MIHRIIIQFGLLFSSVENWDLFEEVMEYSYKKHIKSESHMHPVLMSEPAVCRIFSHDILLILNNTVSLIVFIL